MGQVPGSLQEPVPTDAKVDNNMLLAIDVGNTTVNVGIFNNDRLILTKKIITKRPVSKKYYLAEFRRILKNEKVKNVIISSVVPEVTTILKTLFKKDSNLRTMVLGQDAIVPIKNFYRNPRQVGQDRLVNAYAGYKKFGGGVIIVDFGTAVTFDVISKKGEYLGGIIFPGIEISLNALSQKAALLPKITLKKPKVLIGKDTITSMRSGILNGYAALCAGLVSKIKKEAGKDYKVILTGGHAKLISKYCHFDIIQPNLTLEGLNLLYKYFLERTD